jgi:hypothetical protein
VNLKRWRYDAALSVALMGCAEESGEIHQLHHEGLLMVGRF